MGEAFVIMQIGNADLDRVCDEVIFPAIAAAGLEPRRVDRHNTGDLLKSEIVAFIERADIVVADLTNARPNCYLEVGYAMGLGKKRNLILTVREDHHHGSPNYVRGGPRVHFDLEGYDILFWDPAAPDEFRAQLERRIKRRLAVVRPVPSGGPAVPLVPEVDPEWRDGSRAAALAGLARTGFAGYWEACAAIEPKGSWSQQELLKAVEDSEVRTFGWPIGVVLPQDEHRPRPTAGGVRAEVSIPPGTGSGSHASYDYWSVDRVGRFYLLRSLFEDTRSRTPAIFFNTRIAQVTELLLFLSRLYARLGVSETASVRVWLAHGGLEGRVISATGNRAISMRPHRPSAESEVTSELSTTVGGLEAGLTEGVKALLSPLFTLFDFFQVGDAILNEIVDKFVDGQLT